MWCLKVSGIFLQPPSTRFWILQRRGKINLCLSSHAIKPNKIISHLGLKNWQIGDIQNENHLDSWLRTAWPDLPNRITILKTQKSHVHHSWRSQDEKLYIRHPQAQLLMGNMFFILSQVYKWLYSTLGAFPLRLTLPMQNRVLQAKTGWWHINCWNEFLLDTGKMSSLPCTAITWTCGENEAEISRITGNLIYNTKTSHANNTPEDKPLCWK